jgi:hypothetical protein
MEKIQRHAARSAIAGGWRGLILGASSCGRLPRDLEFRNRCPLMRRVAYDKANSTRAIEEAHEAETLNGANPGTRARRTL